MEQTLEKELTQGTKDPFWRAYMPIYGLSDYTMARLASNLSSDGRRIVLSELLRTPMTYQQLLQRYRHLVN